MSIDKNGFWKSPGAFGNDKTDLGQVYGGSVNSQNGVLGKSMGLLSMTKHGWGQVHGGFLELHTIIWGLDYMGHSLSTP